VGLSVTAAEWRAFTFVLLRGRLVPPFINIVGQFAAATGQSGFVRVCAAAFGAVFQADDSLGHAGLLRVSGDADGEFLILPTPAAALVRHRRVKTPRQRLRRHAGLAAHEDGHRRLGTALQSHQHPMVRFGHVVALAQVVLNLVQQLDGHLRIGQRAVSRTGALQVMKVHQGAELVVG
jgi:hypothetical protein